MINFITLSLYHENRPKQPFAGLVIDDERKGGNESGIRFEKCDFVTW